VQLSVAETSIAEDVAVVRVMATDVAKGASEMKIFSAGQCSSKHWLDWVKISPSTPCVSITAVPRGKQNPILVAKANKVTEAKKIAKQGFWYMSSSANADDTPTPGGEDGGFWYQLAVPMQLIVDFRTRVKVSPAVLVNVHLIFRVMAKKAPGSNEVAGRKSLRTLPITIFTEEVG